MVSSPSLLWVPDNDVGFLRDGREAFPKMLGAIRNARRLILLEMYSIADDHVGSTFARSLADRAAAGVEVLVLYDSLGSRSTPRGFFGWMRRRGIRVLEINPLRRLLSGAPLRWRDHRKILAVDEEVAFVGGLNLSRQYSPPEEGGSGWRDTELEIRGPLAVQLSGEVLALWEAHGGTSIVLPTGGPRPDSPRPGMVRAEGLLLDSVHRGGRGAFGRALRALVSRAKERVWMSTPYLLPTASLRRALRRAAARQVDVRLLVPRVSDHPLVHYASQHYFARFLRWGIRLLQWEGGMMHTKAAAIDGEISALGSSNLDPLSLRRNDEVNVLFRSTALTARLEAILRDDFARAEEVLARTWRERGRLRRLLERACSFGSFLF